MDMVSMEDVIQNTNHLLPRKKKTRNRHGEHGGCDSKHNITYWLRKINKNKWTW